MLYLIIIAPQAVNAEHVEEVAGAQALHQSPILRALKILP